MFFKYFIVIFIFCSCSYNLRTENYFLPKNFDGNVVIIYNPKSKESFFQKKVVNFYIPDSGILRTNKHFYEGNMYTNYYQKNDNNKYDTLIVETPNSKWDSTKNRIYFKRVLTIQEDKKIKYIITTFYVGTKKKSAVNQERFFFERDLRKKLMGNKY